MMGRLGELGEAELERGVVWLREHCRGACIQCAQVSIASVETGG